MGDVHDWQISDLNEKVFALEVKLDELSSRFDVLAKAVEELGGKVVEHSKSIMETYHEIKKRLEG